MANKRIDEHVTATPDGDEWLLIQDPTTLGYNKASASSITGSTAYTKTQSDAALALKADQVTTYTKIEVDASLAGKAETIHVHTIADTTGLQAALDGKQATLVSGTNIKTINGTSVLGSGDITITGGTGAVDSVNSQTGVVVLDADDISDAVTTNKFVTAADKTKLSNLSGTNTGDQDLSGYSTTSHTHTLDNLSDVAITSPSTGQVLKYNGSGWVNDTDATAGGAGSTNLTTTLSSTQTVIVSDTGTDATIPAVDGTNAGVMTPTQKTKLDGIATGATANDTDANLKARANHTGTQSADTITDGTTNKAYTATEKTKLAGIATGATANTGDVVGPASSTTGNIATFSDTTGKLIQDGGKALPTGVIVGTSDPQTLTNKTLTTPTISSTGFTNAQHAHAGATSGGQIPIANTTGTLAVDRGGTGATTLTGILKGNGTSAVTAVTAPSGTIVGTTDTQTLTNKTISTGSTIDANATVTEVLKKVYPVGSIYIATVSTNPSALLGFGTWVAYGEGRVIVGKAASGTFATAGATGGAETHTLVESEMPAHTHPSPAAVFGSDLTGSTYGTGAYQMGTGARNTGSTGGGGAHNNLQPYIVAYIWNRTA